MKNARKVSLYFTVCLFRSVLTELCRLYTSIAISEPILSNVSDDVHREKQARNPMLNCTVKWKETNMTQNSLLKGDLLRLVWCKGRRLS